MYFSMSRSDTESKPSGGHLELLQKMPVGSWQFPCSDLPDPSASRSVHEKKQRMVAVSFTTFMVSFPWGCVCVSDKLLQALVYLYNPPARAFRRSWYFVLIT